MSETSHTTGAVENGDPAAAEELLPLVYDELRRLAAEKLGQERPGQTLQATALVHEAYLRLMEAGTEKHWNSRDHFFAAAAECMRRILIEQARRKRRTKHGGQYRRVDLDEAPSLTQAPDDDLLDLDAALSQLEERDKLAAQVVKLRFFAGLTMPEVAKALGVPLRTAERNWTFARTWLHRTLSPADPSGPGSPRRS